MGTASSNMAHFFDCALVDVLADGWALNAVHAFEEGVLPRRLWRGYSDPPSRAPGPRTGQVFR